MSCHLESCPPSSSDIPQSALDKFLFNWLQKATMWNCTPVIIHARNEMSLRRYLMRRSKSKIKILKGSLKSFLVSRVIQSAQRYLVTWRLNKNTLLLSDTRSCFLEAWFRPSKQFINILNDIVSKAPHLVIFNRRDSLWDPLIRNNKALQTYFTKLCDSHC